TARRCEHPVLPSIHCIIKHKWGVPMRMTPRWATRRDERGVAGVLVAVSMLALIALVMLAVDGGGLYVKRRQMVNASDAAAIAFGIQCVIPNTGTNSGTPDQKADALATANVANAA